LRIGIYNELSVHTLGGAEYAVAVLADDLKQGNHVEIINHCPTMTIEELAEFSGTDLTGVRMRYIPSSNEHYGVGRNLLRRYRHERNWHAELSKPYDLFINFAHWIPPFCHARVGVLIVLFPLFIPPRTVVGEPAQPVESRSIRNLILSLYYRLQWPRRLASYRVKLAISHFTQSWTRKWWNVSCPVLYPPVNTEMAVVEKTKTILSVGRFTPSHTMDSKKQLELTQTFAAMDEARRTGWQLSCAGRVSDVSVDQEYFEKVQNLSGTCGARALANVPREEVNRLLETSAIFWHATGLGADPSGEPHAAEHFGISTGEAMAAGCVPVVMNRGGLQELVQHGVNGFLWNDLKELKDLTTLLIRNDQLRNQMSEAARIRGKNFSRANFRQGFRKHVGRFIPALAANSALPSPH
jgi:L-malate glycosyltransferase